MPIIRSATRRDPSLSLVSPGLGGGSSAEAGEQGAPPSVDSSVSMADGTPPDSDGERKGFLGSGQSKNPRGSVCPRKRLRFASQSVDAAPLWQDFSDDGEESPTRDGRVLAPSPGLSAGEPGSLDRFLSCTPSSSSPAVDKSRCSFGRDKSLTSFSDDGCHSNPRRRSSRLASKGFEVSNGADSYSNSAAAEKSLLRKSDAGDAGDSGLGQKQKAGGLKRRRVSKSANTADDGVTGWETAVGQLSTADDGSISVVIANPPSAGESLLTGDDGGNDGETNSSHRGEIVGKKRNRAAKGIVPIRMSERIASKRGVSKCPRCEISGESRETGNINLNHPATDDGKCMGHISIDLNYPYSADRTDGAPVSPGTSKHEDDGGHGKSQEDADFNIMGSVATNGKAPANVVHTGQKRRGSCSGSSFMVSKDSALRTSMEKGKQVIEVSDGETEANRSYTEVNGDIFELIERDDVADRQTEKILEATEKDRYIYPRKKKKQHPGKTRQCMESTRDMDHQFAYCNTETGEASSSLPASNNNGNPELGNLALKWPGPISTTYEIILMRDERLAARQKKLASGPDMLPMLEWTPSRVGDDNRFFRPPPSLRDLCLSHLCEHIEDVTSFEGIPDEVLIEIGYVLCASRRLNSRALDLILRVSQVEVRILDCSNITEQGLEEAWFARRRFDELKVLHLDLCGRCVSDNILQASFSCFSEKLLCLTSLSLKGAYRITDVGLLALVSVSPALTSINLSECTSVTEAGIYELAGKLTASLKELYIDGCQQLDAMAILHSLLNLKKLEVLSIAGIQSVSDTFISKLVSVHGPRMKVLIVADCGNLTNTSIKAIAARCGGLCTLSLKNLHYLTDAAIGCLADGCRSIQVLEINRCSFSDEAISAFLGASGQFLTDFSANGVKEVAHNTAMSIANCCTKGLLRLDLSWCRKLTDEALGLIADSCLSLRELKIFGCTQITSKFLDGHSNLQLQIVGLRDNCLIPKDFAILKLCPMHV